MLTGFIVIFTSYFISYLTLLSGLLIIVKTVFCYLLALRQNENKVLWLCCCSATGRMDCQSSRRKNYSAVPGRQLVAIQPYLPLADGEIVLHKNDKVKGQYKTQEYNFYLSVVNSLFYDFPSLFLLILYSLDTVLSVGEGGYSEGSCRGHVGWFPARCVEEFPVKADKGRLRKSQNVNLILTKKTGLCAINLTCFGAITLFIKVHS